jgi:hypothetical protein
MVVPYFVAEDQGMNRLLTWAVTAGLWALSLSAVWAQSGSWSEIFAPGLPAVTIALSEESAERAAVTTEGLTVTVSYEAPTRSGECGYADCSQVWVAMLTVEVAGQAALEVKGAATMARHAGAAIAELDAMRPGPEILFFSYTGGAHCCDTSEVLVREPNGWGHVELGYSDGGVRLRDIDGDGRFEILDNDDRFLYAFGNFAGSAPPVEIRAIEDGAVVDVSSDGRFRVVQEEYLARLEEDLVDWRGLTMNGHGLVAGWLATKVLLGEGVEGWERLLANWPQDDPGFQLCTNDRGTRFFPAGDTFLGRARACEAGEDGRVVPFPEAVRIFLNDNGYAW